MTDPTKPLRDRLSNLIDEHKRAAAYCMTYNNLAAWLHTMIAATTVALSAAQQASSDRNLGIALIVLTAVTTTISFWQNICRFASRFAAHSTAISRSVHVTMQALHLLFVLHCIIKVQDFYAGIAACSHEQITLSA
ncbi:hypothetical protein CVIRNUC_000306 [Coccomyxa viridis]|uniref:Uncharacterized protein n=1 Tax=Coccomyxa viridis TaxID=1274662 RepID=A0AAV1HRG4_9CHLO|nr:hypothetical protein CVIRNUC_000306 [Coccomyxa viridis]